MTTGRGINVLQIAQDWFASVVGHFQQAGITLPARRGIVPGEPRAVAWDCEQFVLTLGGIGFGVAVDASSQSTAPGPETSVTALRHCVMDLTLVRCTPQPARNATAPTIEALDAAGQQFFREAGILSQACVEFCTHLRKGFPPEGKVQPGVIEPIGPAGGYHALATVLTVTASRLS